MKQDLTDITLVVDRSGSMHEIQSDAEGGINAFIADQAKEPGEVLLTLVQFDTEYEFVHRGVPASEVPRYRLVPRGSTALLDAVGRAIHDTGDRLSKMPEPERPSLVIFVVMTDGLENSSKEFKKSHIKVMIERQQKEYDWQFTFLGANQDAFAEAADLGIGSAGAADFSMNKVALACRAVGSKVSRMRGQARTGEQILNEFTEDEREQMK